MGLPGFDMNSWQSTIRDEVRIHQNYRDLTAFQGRETSDIVYNDTKSTLTGILCQAHYLNEQMWAGRNPKYFIEVKTTTEACEHAFYVSAAQLKRVCLHFAFPLQILIHTI